MSAPADFIHEAEMGFSHGEFLRGLPAAVAPYCIEKESEAVYQLRHDARCIVVTLQPEARRALGAIAIPVTAVKLEFFGFNRASFEGFLRRYRRHMHKGGG
ncbi:MAG: hypothetical protein OD817_02375 [Gammaproteobacteria bacterium]